MEYDSNLKGALWQKIGKEGKKYYSGQITIDGQEYYVSLFKNEKKITDKHPDLNLVLKPKEKRPTDIFKGNTNPEYADENIPF